DGAVVDGGWLAEAAARLHRDCADGDEEDDGVRQGGEDRALTVAVGPLLRRLAAGEPGGAPGEGEAEHVAEIVPGIGEQRHRARQNAEGRLDRDEAEIEGDSEAIGRLEAPRRVPWRVMRVRMTGVIVRHQSSPRRGFA